MKLIFKTAFFHILLIFSYSIIYYINHTSFTIIRPTYLDHLFLSTTIQAGVGLNDMMPSTPLMKWIIISQHLTLLLMHIITIYVFTI